ncbi:hypothetical protein JXQ70_10680 [bacterium]|nr:hypothetical protein [bacterium]
MNEQDNEVKPGSCEQDPLKQDEHLVSSTKKQLVRSAEFVKKMAEKILGQARFLSIMAILAAGWLWFLLFQSLLFSLSLWLIPALIVLLIMLLPSLILFWFIWGLRDLIDLPALVRDHIHLNANQAKKIAVRLPNRDNESVPSGKCDLARWFQNVIALFGHLNLIMSLWEISGTVITLFNPIQKILVLWSIVISIVLIFLAVLTGAGYLLYYFFMMMML